MIRRPLNLAAPLARHLPIGGPRIDQRAPFELDGRVVFVTGAARGLGAEVARQAYAKGCVRQPRRPADRAPARRLG